LEAAEVFESVSVAKLLETGSSEWGMERKWVRLLR
jgi:hypothetical protein